MTTIRIRQKAAAKGKHDIFLTLTRSGQPDLEGKATIKFAMTRQEQEDLRWYMEDYLQHAESVEEVQVEQIEGWMKQRGEELYNKVLDANQNTHAIWFAVREQLADLRIEITTGIAEAASIPWELMRDPQSDSAIALRVRAFVRVQPDPNLSFVPVPPAENRRLRLLYIVCRPGGRNDVELRAVANRLLKDLGADLARFDITALRPPTFEQLQEELTDAKAANRPYHIVHFDGHGAYEDLSDTSLADWVKATSPFMPGGQHNGKHGYLLFEHPGSKENMRPVSGTELGKLLHDTGVPVLVLNACQSAMHEATGERAQKPATVNVHDEIRAIGSLAQAVIDHGIPAVLGMRYSVFVVTAAQYIGQFYSALAKARSFGEAASEGRKHLQRNPDRWVGLQPRPLQDWFVPVVYEAAPIQLLPLKADTPGFELNRSELDPAQTNPVLRRYVPDTGFVGRDETLLLLDRAFDLHPLVLLHAYAGQGKSATAVEFARWYAQTGGLGPRPVVLLTSFESHIDLTDVLNQIGQAFAPALQASGIEWHALNDNAVRRRVILQILQQIPVLWIWDNVEPVAGFPAGTESAWTPAEQAELADFLKQIKIDKATKARILLTSRRDEKDWLGDIPHRAAMPRMENSDAAGLVRSLVTERKIAREEIADWQPLLDYCHGNPLTLRVIVGQAIRTGLRGREPIANFVEAIRSGEQTIKDTDERLGREKSLGASLDYGFRNAFQEDEIPILVLLSLFQGTVQIESLFAMAQDRNPPLPELAEWSQERLTSLVERVKDIGLLTQLDRNWFAIHPALPWFLRQKFVHHYDGRGGRSTSESALRCWIRSICSLSGYYHDKFTEGDRSVVTALELQEKNLLLARQIAHKNEWWGLDVLCMAGLDVLYEYQGRDAEWARLVEGIRSDYCTENGEPISGREDCYEHVIGYRVRLATGYERDYARAEMLQQRLIEFCRKEAATSLSLSVDAPLDDKQKGDLSRLAVSVSAMASILRVQEKPDCEHKYQEAIRIYQRIKDSQGEAVAQSNLGLAYLRIGTIRDLTAAEAAFRRSLGLRHANDYLGRSRCMDQIGMVYHERLAEAYRRKEPVETLNRHAKAALIHYIQGLRICPTDASTEFGPRHHSLARLYHDVGRLEDARKHLERAIQCFEIVTDKHNAADARLDMARMYIESAKTEFTQFRQRDLLHRAQAYAEAALRDYQYYQGRAAAEEARAQQLLADIAQDLAKLPP